MRASRAYPVYLVLQGADALFRTMIYTVLAVYYVQRAGLNPLQLVLVGTVLEATCFLFEVPTGIVADTYSRRLSVIIGLFLVGLCFVLEGLIPFFAAILLAEVIRGIGETFISGALEAWIADEVGEERAGAAFLRGAQVSQAAGLAGILLGAGLATLRLNLPVLLGGASLILLGLGLIAVMPEQGFRPTPRGERTSWLALFGTMREGMQLVRQRPLVLTILGIAVISGAFSEGLDRLWEAHFLANVSFPAFASLPPVAWFGILGAGATLLGLATAEVARRRLDTNSHAAVAHTLLATNALLSAAVVAFGLAAGFPLAAGTYWLVGILRTIHGPLSAAWLNQNVDSRVRATLFSLHGQADALGQLGVGPVIGAIGTAFSLRTAIVVAGLLLAPALPLYGWALRQGGATPLVAAEPEAPAAE